MDTNYQKALDSINLGEELEVVDHNHQLNERLNSVRRDVARGGPRVL